MIIKYKMRLYLSKLKNKDKVNILLRHIIIIGRIFLIDQSAPIKSDSPIPYIPYFFA